MTQTFPVSHAAPGRRSRAATGTLLAAGALLAVGTPIVFVLVRPTMSGYLMHPAVILPAFVPYGLCAAIWLRRRAAGPMGVAIATVLFAGTAVTHGPILWSPATFGGDMVALYFFAWALAATAGVLLASAVAALVRRWRVRSVSPEGSA